jgi:hypothetical protein
VRGAWALGLVLLAGAAGAETADVELGPYREALRSGVVGGVTGRAYAERPTPRAADQPLTGTAVTLLPRSPRLLARLEQIRQGARGSADTFRVSATEIRKAREVYERELWEMGGVDLVRQTTVGADGAFVFPGVPAGAWLLIATGATRVDTRSVGGSSKDRATFKVGPRLRGYEAVTIWLRELSIEGGRSASVELTDRNGWFSGVVEDRVQDAGR